MLFLADLAGRITPAYAGKSEIVPCFENGIKDHPRLCGEKALHCLIASRWLGSPPPMRGKVYAVFAVLSPTGITPAYAGKSFRLWKKQPILRDHPRLCGEKWVSGFSLTSKYRITPAYAGKRTVSPFSFTCFWDHPRLCGEKRQPWTPRKEWRGSPPPMRGKGLVRSFSSMFFGITPAYAGKSRTHTAVSSAYKDHPRLCGEKQK